MKGRESTVSRAARKAFGGSAAAFVDSLPIGDAEKAKLSDFMARMEASHEQLERALDLSEKSLLLSSQEMGVANERLERELAASQHAMDKIGAAISELGLAGSGGRPIDVESDVEAAASELLELSRRSAQERRRMDAFQKALDQNAMFCVYGAEGALAYANDRFWNSLGVGAKSLEAFDEKLCFGASLSQAERSLIWEQVSKGEIWRGLLRRERPGLDALWTMSAVAPQMGESGAPESLVEVGVDVTEQMQAKEQMRAHASLVERLFQALPVPVYQKDAEGSVVKANQAYFDLLGLPEEMILGLPQQGWDCSGEPGMLGSGRMASSRQSLGFEGAKIVMDVTVADLGSEGGKPLGLVGVVVDLTDMEKAREAAESANRLKSEFLANMSHEIRTPLNGVLGMVDLACELAADAGQKEYLETAKSSANSLLSIINDILDFSKIEAGKLEIEKVWFDPADLMAQTMRPLAVKAAQKGLAFHLAIDPAFPSRVLSDPVRLRQIAINLASNAIKFTSKGGITVELEWQAGFLALSVSDTGIGIAHDKLSSIFDPFSQEDGSITRRFGGTGLGLSITKRLCEALGGRASVDSTPGKGSRFRARFPAKAEMFEAPASWLELSGKRIALAGFGSKEAAAWVEKAGAFGAECFAIGGVEPSASALAKANLLVCPTAGPAGFDGFAWVEAARSIGSKALLLVDSHNASDLARCFSQGGLTAQIMPSPGRQIVDAACLALASSQPAASARSLAGGGAPVEANGSSKSGSLDLAGLVLVVEDNEINRKLAKSWLDKWGVKHEMACDGSQALDLMGSRRFDLILMDCQMPVMDGFEATRRIRADASADIAKTPIVAMTANAMEGDREKCLAAGMDDYVPKPIDPKQLRLCLRRWLSGIPAQGASEKSGVTEAGALDLEASFDYAAALGRVDVETLDIIGSSLAGSIDADMASIAKALEGENPAGAALWAHSCKGLAATVQAAPLAEAFKRLEAALAASDKAGAMALLPLVQARWRLLRAALIDYLSSSANR